MAHLLTDAIGARKIVELEPGMGGGDFGAYGLAGHEIPTALFRVGATAPERFTESRVAGTPLTSLHSGLFAPVPQPTVRTGVIARASVVLSLIQK